MRVRGVGADGRIIILPAPGVLVGQRLQAVPHALLEFRLGDRLRAFEHHGQAAQPLGLALVLIGPVEQRIMDLEIVPGAADVAAGNHLERAARQCRLGPDTGEIGRADEITEAGFEIDGPIGF